MGGGQRRRQLTPAELTPYNGIAMAWARGASPGGGTPSFWQFKKNNFRVAVNIGTSGHQTLECCIVTLPTYGRLVHVGETFNRFWAVNCIKMRLAAGLRPDSLGELEQSLQPPNRYKGEGAVVRGRG